MQKANGIKKLYYSISEVSKLTQLEQYVLRYWESEFEQLCPAKNRAGNRVYTSKDIKLILFIKELLKDKKFTIEGARQILLTWNSENESGKQSDLFETQLTNGLPEQAVTEEKSLNLPSDYKIDLIKIKSLLEAIHSKLK